MLVLAGSDLRCRGTAGPAILPNDHKPETCGEATIFPLGKVDFENFFSFSRHRAITAVAENRLERDGLGSEPGMRLG